MDEKETKVVLTVLSMIIFSVILLLNHLSHGLSNNPLYSGEGFYLSLITTFLLYAIGLIMLKRFEKQGTIYLAVIIAIVSAIIIYFLLQVFTPYNLGYINDIIMVFALAINIIWYYFSYKTFKSIVEV